MGFRSDSGVGGRWRPSAELVAKLRQGKDDLRRDREELPLPEKIRQVIELQHLQSRCSQDGVP
jgi:hypothetical protein